MTENIQDRISKNYRQVLDGIANAAKSAGRDPGSVKLLVVTKGHPIDTVQAVVKAGGTMLGENYVQDAIIKINTLDNNDVEWHMIGHVQSRKAKLVSEYFSWVHSVDRLKIARRLNNYSKEFDRVLPVMLECNISGEGSKYGWPAWDEKNWPEFADEIAILIEYTHLDVRGLMTMPPYDPNPEKSRKYFVKLRRLRDFLASKFPQFDRSELSMGMSNDYKIAVQEGATFVRVGTAILGPRND